MRAARIPSESLNANLDETPGPAPSIQSIRSPIGLLQRNWRTEKLVESQGDLIKSPITSHKELKGEGRSINGRTEVTDNADSSAVPEAVLSLVRSSVSSAL